MRIRKAVWASLAVIPTLAVTLSHGQTPAKASAKSGGAGMQVESNMGQLMRGVFYPNSNVIFFAQSNDPKDVPPSKESSTATDPLESAYGKWEAVENSALAIAEASNLLTLPRTCANGRAAPVNSADWPKFVQGLRDAGKKAYQAAKTRNQDNMLDAADVLTTACANCHDKYREKARLADRCM